MSRTRYRARQFWLNLFGRLSAAERAEIAAELGPTLYSLFCRLTPGEQSHAVQVWRIVRLTIPDDTHLRAAALLHDVGKARTRLTVLERSAYVLISRCAPALAARWSAGEPHGWRRAFVVGARHADWGAEMAVAAGAAARTVELIRRHQDDPRTATDPALRVLMQADDSS
ncbi:MAG: HD domain-containing protein [Anaerolineales bacterium]